MTQMTAKVAVVRSLHYDVLVTGSRRPCKGETVPGCAWDWKCGGKGGFQAIEAARHGAAADLIGAVGNDPFGAAKQQRLSHARVNSDERSPKSWQQKK